MQAVVRNPGYAKIAITGNASQTAFRAGLRICVIFLFFWQGSRIKALIQVINQRGEKK